MDHHQKVRAWLKYQVSVAAAAKKTVCSRMLVSAVGGLSDRAVGEEVLQAGDADVIFVGREFQNHSGLVWKMAEDLGVEIHLANQIKLGFAGRSVQILGNSEPPKIL